MSRPEDLSLVELDGCERAHPLHIFEELLATPALQFPVIIVLLATADTQSAVAATASAKKSATTQFNLAIVYARHGRSHEIPICLGVEVVGPSCFISRTLPQSGSDDLPASHMDIL